MIDPLVIAAFFYSIFALMVATTLLTPALIRYYENRYEPFLQMRHPILMIAVLFSYTILGAIWNPICLVSCVLWEEQLDHLITVDSTIGLFAMITITTRFWLCYHNYKIQLVVRDLAWKSKINPSTHEEFLVTWCPLITDPKRITRLTVLGAGVVGGIYITLYGFSVSSGLTLARVTTGVRAMCVLFVLSLNYNMNSLRDPYLIKQELQMTGMFGGLTLSIGRGFLIVAPVSRRIRAFVFFGLGGICAMIVVGIATVWVLKKFDERGDTVGDSVQDPLELENYLSGHVRPGTDIRVAFRKCLEDREYFSIFTSYCIEERCVESILFLVEMAQVQTVICQLKGNRSMMQKTMNRWTEGTCPSTFLVDCVLNVRWLPINERLEICETVNDALDYIMTKYIHVNAADEINISFETRQNMKQLECMDVESDEFLEKFMDASFRTQGEIYALVVGVWCRFQGCPMDPGVIP